MNGKKDYEIVLPKFIEWGKSYILSSVAFGRWQQ